MWLRTIGLAAAYSTLQVRRACSSFEKGSTIDRFHTSTVILLLLSAVCLLLAIGVCLGGSLWSRSGHIPVWTYFFRCQWASIVVLLSSMVICITLLILLLMILLLLLLIAIILQSFSVRWVMIWW